MLCNPLHSSQAYTQLKIAQTYAQSVVAYITIHVLLASDPRPEGSKLLAAVENFVAAVDLKVLLATRNESHNPILISSKISGGVFLVWSVDNYCPSLNVHISFTTAR